MYVTCDYGPVTYKTLKFDCLYHAQRCHDCQEDWQHQFEYMELKRLGSWLGYVIFVNALTKQF